MHGRAKRILVARAEVAEQVDAAGLKPASDSPPIAGSIPALGTSPVEVA